MSLTNKVDNLPPELVKLLAQMATKFSAMHNPAAIQLVLEFSVPIIAQLYKGKSDSVAPAPRTRGWDPK